MKIIEFVKKEKKKQKKILCSLALCGMTLLSTISVAYAAPSISKNGTIDNSSILVNGEKTELVAKFSNDSSVYREIGVPDNVINDIDKINQDPTQLKEILGYDNMTLLTAIQDLSLHENNGKPTKQNNVTITWEVPNLSKNIDTANVKVLHYSVERSTWEILTPKSVNIDSKTITQEFKDLSPVAVMYSNNTESTTKTDKNSVKTGDSNLPYMWTVLVLSSAAAILLFIKKALFH